MLLDVELLELIIKVKVHFDMLSVGAFAYPLEKLSTIGAILNTVQ